MPEQTTEGFRVSPQQVQLWRAQQQAGGETFRAVCAVEVRGALDAAALESAARLAAARHEILRTSLHTLPGMSLPVQVIESDGELSFVRHDWRASDAREQRRQLDALFESERRPAAPAETRGAHLLRCSLLALADERHILLISLPALCADARSLHNLAREVCVNYEAALNAAAPAGEVMQYADVSEILNELLEAADTEAGREYWRSRRPRGRDAVRLPLADHDARSASFDPQLIERRLDADLAGQLASAAAREGAPVSTLLLACWQVWLWRVAGQPVEVTVGVLFDGRSYEGLEDALGVFAKHLPLTFDFAEGQRLPEVLQRVAGAVAEASRWQEYFSWPEAAADETDEAGGFFPFCFESAPEPASWSAHAATTFAPIRHYACFDRFKIKLEYARGDGADAPRLNWHYDAGALKGEQVVLLAEQFEALLASVVGLREPSLAELELLGQAERRRLLVEFNDTRVDFGAGRSLHHLFEEQAARTPSRTALVFDNESLSYAELDARANQLAHRLLREGVRADAPVAICVERSMEMVVGLLGILKAGGAYLPLDPEYPRERLSFMLEDARPSVVLTQERLEAGLPEQAGRVLRLDTDWPLIAAERTDTPAVVSTVDNLAYIIYTSGSTGRPKGTMISHRAICNHMLWMQSEFPLAAEDRVLQKTPISFDASVWEFYAPLLSGAALALAHPWGHQDTSYLCRVVNEQQVTTLQLVPSLLRVLLEEKAFASCRSLRRVFCGGEALTADLQAAFFATGLDASLHNLYGPTEATIDATFHTAERDAGGGLSVPIGRPVSNTEAYVLDGLLNPVPTGVAGELYLGGDGLARGYLNRPGLTAERFIPHPFARGAGARLYRTGDTVRHLSTGVLEYLGRADAQVKLRGNRVELGEVEALLSAHPSVRAAVAVVREDASGEAALLAYVVSDETAAADSVELRTYLRAHAPEYMVPSEIITLERFPLLPNGKVDRRALPAPRPGQRQRTAAYTAPRTELEQSLAALWQEFLHVEQVSATDNFFDLGGHSLLMIRVHSRLQELLGRSLPIVKMFQYPTIEALAQWLDEGEAAPDELALDETRQRVETRRESARRQRQVRAGRRAPGGV
ncbi:MAG TPA: amino acid adenylation domain-containing protein [Pyrinomonadaceae bacterium]|nr:amino acid adenylation domain-containing protein [Pyrinomonadaceae bacterium]